MCLNSLYSIFCPEAPIRQFGEIITFTQGEGSNLLDLTLYKSVNLKAKLI